MVLPFVLFILRNSHAVRTYVPSDGALLLDIANVKGQVRYAMAEWHFQVLSNRFAPVNCLMMGWQVNCIFGLDSSHSIEIPCIPMPGPLIAHPADSTCATEPGFRSGGAPHSIPFHSCRLLNIGQLLHR